MTAPVRTPGSAMAAAALSERKATAMVKNL